MRTEDIKKMIEQGLAASEARVTGDGTHFEATVICNEFDGKSMLEQHRMVYATLGNSMEGAIHAMSIRTYTPLGWEKAQQKKIT